MPSYEEDIPRLAEIARTLSDFRSEFREAVGSLVRSDVYAAEKRAMEQKYDSEMHIIEQRIEQIVIELSREKEDRKSIRNAFIGASSVSAIALLISIIKSVG